MEADWEPFVPVGYGDPHRAFLQALMSRGTMTFEEGQNVLAVIRAAAEGEDPGAADPQTVTMEEFVNFVRITRDAVEPLDYDIRNTRDQRSGERVWAFVNAQSDAQTQLGTTHGPEELAYIRRLFDAMFDDHNTPRLEVMAVDEGQAIKVSRPRRNRESAVGATQDAESSTSAAVAVDRGLKHSEVLSLLASLIEEGWLVKSRNGFYSLSPRALMELWSWLVASYNDSDAGPGEWQRIKSCESCKEIITDGQRCSEPDCLVRLHDICEANFWRTRPDKTCPKCKTAWSGNHFVGERAVTSRSGFQRSRGARRSGGRREADSEEEEE